MTSSHSDKSNATPLFTAARIGSLELKNRFIRAPTGETMADAEGNPTNEFINLHIDLAKGGVALQILGHIFVSPNGKQANWQTGIYKDSNIPSLRQVTDAIHANDGKVFAEISHAGSQTRLNHSDIVAPSAVENNYTHRLPRALSTEEVWTLVDEFGQAGQRAKEANFDGVHIHGANGYLISEFNSPISNHRTDEWGGSEQERSKFLFEVYKSVRKKVGSDYPVTVKLGMEDALSDGLTVEESLHRAKQLEEEGVCAIEVGRGLITEDTGGGGVKYVALTNSQAVSDLLLYRLFRKNPKEAYFLQYSRALKKVVNIPIMLVGGLRTIERMVEIIRAGEADFISLARPLIREPDLINQIQNGRWGQVDCTSCNLCRDHAGKTGLMCWRKNRRLLLRAMYERFLP